MNSIKNIVDSSTSKIYTGGVSDEIINNAELQLKLTFASDYKELLSNYGSLIIGGDEFLGIDTVNYDIVKATEEARNMYPDFPKSMYVIENMYIDGILLVQNTQGAIFVFQSRKTIQKVKDNLKDYLMELLM